MGEFLFTIEDPEFPLAVSVYNHPGTGDKLAWVKIHRGVLEISNLEMFDALIELLQYTKTEIEKEQNYE